MMASRRVNAFNLTEFLVWFSIACLVLLPIFLIATPARDALNEVQQNQPYQWYEFLRTFLIWSAVPAMSGVVLLFARSSAEARRGLLIVMMILGMIMTLLSYLGESIQHLDCGLSCVASVPTALETFGLIALMVIFWVILPWKILKLQKQK